MACPRTGSDADRGGLCAVPPSTSVQTQPVKTFRSVEIRSRTPIEGGYFYVVETGLSTWCFVAATSSGVDVEC